MPDGTGAAQDQQTPTPSETPNHESTAAGDATATNNGGEERRFTQAEVNALITKRLEQERKQGEQRIQREREAAEAKRLEENQEYQKLAEQRAKRLSELEPLKDKAERYEAALTKLLAEERKGVPEYVIPILDKLEPDEQLAWIAEHKGSFPAPTDTQQQQRTTRALPQTPRPAAPQAPPDLVAAQEKQLRESGRYVRLG